MWRWTILTAALTACHCVAGPQTASAEEHRLALVIGNSAYAFLPPLRTCAASASVVSAALKRAGFEVTERRDASNAELGAAIADFGDAIAREPRGAAVAYACGYAVEFDGRVFLLPASANLQRETDALTQGVVSRVLIDAVTAADARAGLVLLDSVTPPGRAALRLEKVVAPTALGGTGFVATNSTATPPDGPSPLAAAVVAGLAPAQVDARALLGDLRDELQLQAAPGVTSVVYLPAGPAWLRGAPPPPPEPAAPPAPVPQPEASAATPPGQPVELSEADRRRAQLALQRLGYYDGKVDGIFGADTLAAIRRFQHELKSNMTGRLTNDQLGRLLPDAR
jgi:hypothetical protein